jgi:hypothetical protein
MYNNNIIKYLHDVEQAEIEDILIFVDSAFYLDEASDIDQEKMNEHTYFTFEDDTYIWSDPIDNNEEDIDNKQVELHLYICKRMLNFIINHCKNQEQVADAKELKDKLYIHSNIKK